jgi:hypothetical protein
MIRCRDELMATESGGSEPVGVLLENAIYPWFLGLID